MLVKILAGVVAALVVTGAGVYVAFSDYNDMTQTAGASLPVSEGGCCADKAACSAAADGCPHQAECTGQTCTPDALAACTGSAATAVSPKARKGCCED